MREERKDREEEDERVWKTVRGRRGAFGKRARVESE
jgi:hypothetical protein